VAGHVAIVGAKLINGGRKFKHNSNGHFRRLEIFLNSLWSLKNLHTHTAREYDFETGLYFYRARYYDPRAGRFITKDPIGFGGGDVNLYGYVKNNPISRTDPFGLFKCVYSISRHTMICDSNNYSSPNASFASNNFVSGNNNGPDCTDCQNNPDRTDKKYENHGPIPPGLYNIGPLHGRHRRDLTPNPNNGRSGFQIHGCGDDPNKCSAGCIGSTVPSEINEFNRIMSLEEGKNTLFVTQ
jgi:RHS repeat-associated protein